MQDSLAGNVCLWLITGYALYTDLRYRKVTNRTILLGLISGVVYGAFCGFGILMSGIAGAALALAINAVPFMMGLLGGGDVKLMMVIGLYTGPQVLIEVFVVTAIVGAVIALAVMIYSGEFISIIMRLYHQLASIVIGARIMTVDKPRNQTRIPYVAAISIGLLYSTCNVGLTLF